VGLLLTTNSIKALRELTFYVTRGTFSIEPLPTDLRGYRVSLESVLVWAVREYRLHQKTTCTNADPQSHQTIEFSIKLDGRPLAGSYNGFVVVLNYFWIEIKIISTSK